MSWGDSLDLKILRSVTCKFENFSSQILKDSSTVYSGCGSDSAVSTNSALQNSVNSSNWELNNFKYELEKLEILTKIIKWFKTKEITNQRQLSLIFDANSCISKPVIGWLIQEYKSTLVSLITYLESSSWCFALWGFFGKLSGAEFASFASFSSFSCLISKNSVIGIKNIHKVRIWISVSIVKIVK